MRVGRLGGVEWSGVNLDCRWAVLVAKGVHCALGRALGKYIETKRKYYSFTLLAKWVLTSRSYQWSLQKSPIQLAYLLSKLISTKTQTSFTPLFVLHDLSAGLEKTAISFSQYHVTCQTQISSEIFIKDSVHWNNQLYWIAKLHARKMINVRVLLKTKAMGFASSLVM